MSITGLDQTGAELNAAVDELGMTPPRLLGAAAAFLRWGQTFTGMRDQLHQVRIVETPLPAPALTVPDRGIIWMTAEDCERIEPLEVGTAAGMLKNPIPHGKFIHEVGHNMAPSKDGWDSAERGLHKPLVLLNELLAEQSGATGLGWHKRDLLLALLGLSAKRVILVDIEEHPAEGRGQWESVVALALGRDVIGVLKPGDPLIGVLLELLPDVFSAPEEAEARLRSVMKTASMTRTGFSQVKLAREWVAVFDELFIGDEPEPDDGGDEPDEDGREGEGPGPTPAPKGDDEDSDDGDDSDDATTEKDPDDGDDSDGDDSSDGSGDDGEEITRGKKAIEKFLKELEKEAAREGEQDRPETEATEPDPNLDTIKEQAEVDAGLSEKIKAAERRVQAGLSAAWGTGAGVNFTAENS